MIILAKRLNRKMSKIVDDLLGVLRHHLDADQKTLINTRFDQLEKKIMAKFQEILTAVQNNGVLIGELATEITEESNVIKEALEAAKAGSVDPQQLDQAVATLNQSNEALGKIKDVVANLVPTIKSPEQPSEATTPLPQPTEPVPTTPDQVNVGSAESTAGEATPIDVVS